MTEAWLTALALIVDLARGPQTGLRAQSVCGPFLLIKFYCHPTRQVGTAETTWPTKPKILALWPFTGSPSTPVLAEHIFLGPPGPGQMNSLGSLTDISTSQNISLRRTRSEVYKVTKPAEMERGVGDLLVGSAQGWVRPAGVGMGLALGLPRGVRMASLGGSHLATFGAQHQGVITPARSGTRQ